MAEPIVTSNTRIINLVGNRFGKVVVEAFAGVRNTNSHWKCRCDCGHVFQTSGSNLKRNGVVTGCKLCAIALRAENKKTHGMCGTVEYNTWAGMKARCDTNPDYAGRGIEICERWKYSFENFFSDMGKRPPNTTIDRINNNGHYSPENCRWATVFQQQRNTRKNVRFTIRGVTKCGAEWAEEYGISLGLFWHRIYAGWSAERAISELPGESKEHLIIHDGHTLNVKQWASKIGVSEPTIHNRIRAGWPIEKVLQPQIPPNKRAAFRKGTPW